MKISLGERLRRSNAGRVFGGTDDGAKGRRCMLANSMLSSFVANLIGGIFYTGFLVGYGISIVSIGIISFLPTIATLFSIFSPYVLERMKKRKKVLAIARITYYVINIFGITLVPYLTGDNRTRVILITLIAFVATAVNSVFTQGYSAWHANFLTDDVRGDYLMLNSFTNAFVFVIILAVSIVTDSISDSALQLKVIIIIRIAAFAIALIDTLMLCIPREYEYEKSREKPRITDIFTIPSKNKKFMLTMLVVVLWYFASCLTNAVLNTYILSDIGVSYTLINGINAGYFLFFIVFMPIWRKFVAKHGWFRAFAYSGMMQGITYLIYAFITPGNYVWLFITARLLQHVTGIIVNLCVSNLPYINLPEADRTNYFSFYTIVANVTAFASMMAGTYFVKLMSNSGLDILGHTFYSVPLLLVGTGALEIAVGFVIRLLSKPLTPAPRKPVPLSVYISEKASEKQEREKSETEREKTKEKER